MMKVYEAVLSKLGTLGLRGISQRIDEEIQEAESQKTSYTGFLNNLLDLELNYRVEKRLQRNMIGAHFPVNKNLDEFEFGKVKGITKTEISQLLDFIWLDNNNNVL